MLDGSGLRVVGEHATDQRYDADAGYQSSFDATVLHFVARLRDGRPFETAPEDNLETLALVEAVYRAAAG